MWLIYIINFLDYNIYFDNIIIIQNFVTFETNILLLKYIVPIIFLIKINNFQTINLNFKQLINWISAKILIINCYLNINKYWFKTLSWL